MIDYNKVLNYSIKDWQSKLNDSAFSQKAKKCIDGINLLLYREI